MSCPGQLKRCDSSHANRKCAYFGLCIPSRAWAPTERNISIVINRSQLLLSPSMKHMFIGTIKRNIKIRYNLKVPYFIMLKNQLLWIEILSFCCHLQWNFWFSQQWKRGSKIGATFGMLHILCGLFFSVSILVLKDIRMQ